MYYGSVTISRLRIPRGKDGGGGGIRPVTRKITVVMLVSEIRDTGHVSKVDVIVRWFSREEDSCFDW